MTRMMSQTPIILGLLATALCAVLPVAGLAAAGCVPDAPKCLMNDGPLPPLEQMPPMALTGATQVPACVTPLSLMKFVASQHKIRVGTDRIDPRFNDLANEYKRFGMIHKIRWDYAFFQMMNETGHLTYTTKDKTSGKWVPGAVRPEHNNFAGVGAVITGREGEKFTSIPRGVEAHFKHLVIYTGGQVEPPMAKRTCQVQKAVNDCAARFNSRAVTFTDMAKQWSGEPSHEYGKVIKSIACRFAAQQKCPGVVVGKCPSK